MPQDDTIFLPIPVRFRNNMSKTKLYEATRGDWRVAYARHGDIKYAVAVVNRFIKKVYKVESWERASKGKWKFCGKVIEKHNDLIDLPTPGRSQGTVYYGDFSELMSLKSR